jgi:hypothetical protein
LSLEPGAARKPGGSFSALVRNKWASAKYLRDGVSQRPISAAARLHKSFLAAVLFLFLSALVV